MIQATLLPYICVFVKVILIAFCTIAELSFEFLMAVVKRLL